MLCALTLQLELVMGATCGQWGASLASLTTACAVQSMKLDVTLAWPSAMQQQGQPVQAPLSRARSVSSSQMLRVARPLAASR